MDNPDVIMFGMMSSMRTNNMLLDMLLCLMVPFLFRHLWQYANRGSAYMTDKLARASKSYYERSIEHTVATCPWMDSEGSKVHNNQLLITAVRQYVGRVVEPKYDTAECKLTSIRSTASAQSMNLPDTLEKRYKRIYIPTKNDFVEIEPGLFYRDSENVTVEGDEERRRNTRINTKTTTRVVLRTDLSGGKDRVDAFVKKAYDWYVSEVEKSEDNSKFMYQPLVKSAGASSGDDKDKGQQAHKYKRYKLSGEKNFKSLFFPEKERVLKLLTAFKDRSGKYSIPGFPHKLGLLLYGPPGTGKTSLVKAVAERTGRHIISVPLSRIRTNQELMDVMFDQVFPYTNAGGKSGGGGGDDDDDDEGGGGSGISNKLKIDEVIFLLEDVDAASKVVQNRGENLKMTTVEQQAKLLGAAGTSDKKKKKKKKGDSDDESESGSDKDKDDDEEEKKKKKEKLLKLFQMEKDKLDLAGLLNVLDGVVDAPGRILIMTTNHPEKLDPAILRPGRINLKLYMGHIQPNEARQMTQHYYPGATEENLEKVREIFQSRIDADDLKLSPAEFEQLCAESQSIEELHQAMRIKGLPSPTKSGVFRQ